MADVLIVSDRPEELSPIAGGLEAGGHRTGVAGSDEIRRDGPDPDVAIVDAVKDLSRARDVCRALRTRNERLPVIAIIAPEAFDAIGPDWGVDTFIADGAGVPELLARLRLTLGSQLLESSGTVRVGDLSIDPETYQVRIKGRPLDLTYKEFQLLFYLAQKPGRVYTRQQLLQEVWGYDFFGGTRTVDVHIRRLRAKLGAEHEGMIVTIRNVGYKMESHRPR